MKGLLVLVAFFSLGQSTPVIQYKETFPYNLKNFTGPLPHVKVSDNDVKIYFIHRGSQMTQLDISNSETVKKHGYVKDKDTAFIVHGWQNAYNSPVNQEISNALLKVKDLNVFIVDWNNIAKEDYVRAKAAVPQISQIVAKLVNKLIKNNGLNLQKTFFIGHSLGAHVAGIAGSSLGGKVSHIVGLDPALPLFNWADKNSRLDSKDAQFVQIIHTCSGVLGFNKALGHADYWPNGGSDQPGCGGVLDVGGTCSHGRSYEYFAESVISGGFVSHACDSYKNFSNGKCNSAAKSSMGQYSPDLKARGNYYLKTNSKSPYALH